MFIKKRIKILSFNEYRVSNAVWIQSQIKEEYYRNTLFVQIAFLYLEYLIICGISQKEKENLKCEINSSEFYLNKKFNCYSTFIESNVYEYFELLFKHKSSVKAFDIIESKYNNQQWS